MLVTILVTISVNTQGSSWVTTLVIIQEIAEQIILETLREQELEQAPETLSELGLAHTLETSRETLVEIARQTS